MATNSMDCIMVSSAWAKDGSWNEHTAEHSGYAGAYSEGYYTFCLKFQTAKFVGISEQIVFQLKLYNIGPDDTTLRCALCKSDANKNKYTGYWPDSIYSEVEDEHQLTQGTIEWTGILESSQGGSMHTLSIETEDLKPETEYYLLLWSYYSRDSISTTVRLAGAAEHGAIAEYNSGLIQIKYDGHQISCVVDVVKDGAWKQAMPEVTVNGAWKQGC